MRSAILSRTILNMILETDVKRGPCCLYGLCVYSCRLGTVIVVVVSEGEVSLIVRCKVSEDFFQLFESDSRQSIS